MTAEGFTIGTGAFLSSSAEQYFKKHKQLPPRGLTITKVSTPAGADSFQNLLQAMAQSKLTRFLVYAHGQSDGSGLYLRLATRRGLAQGAQATFNVINSLISLGESGKPATDRQLNYLQITQAELATIVALMKSIRGKNIECIEFRGCNLGRNATSAASFKKFFGAKVFGAPDFYSFFGRSTVHIGATYVDRLKKSRTSGNWHEYVYAFQQPEGTLTNHILTDGDLKPTEGYIIADSVATVQRWVKSYIDAAGGYEASDGYVLLHGMWDTGKRKIDVNELENMPIGSDMKTLSPAIIMPIGSDDFKNHVIYV